MAIQRFQFVEGKSAKRSRRRLKSERPHLTPEDYHARDAARVARFLVTSKNFCAFMGVDSNVYLTACAGENFRCYADWRLRQFNVTKQSTIWVEWKFLRLLYKRVAGKKMDEIAGEQVSEFILGPLTDEYSLDLSVECKPTLSVEDLLSVLHYHWCLDTSAVPHEWYTVQLPLLMLMIAYTSSHPGALIKSDCVRGSNDALRYRDVVLHVIPNPEEPGRHVLIMEITLMFMKGKRNKSQPTTYIFHERDDNLALCPISHFLALALADQAFETQGINSPENILHIEVPPYRNSLQLKWRSEMLDIPVIHRTVHTAHRVRISPDLALPYNAFKSVPSAARPQRRAQRSTDSLLHQERHNKCDVATAAERNQVLGHSRADIFEHYYLLQKNDELDAGPEGPQGADQRAEAAIEHDPHLAKLNHQKQNLISDMRYQYRSVPKAQSTDIYTPHDKLKRTIQSERQFLRKHAQNIIQKKFFININIIEIKCQLLGLSLTDDLKIEDPIVQFICVKRARLARSLFRSLSSSAEEVHEPHRHRMQVIRDWTALCSLQDIPYKQRNAPCKLVMLKEKPSPIDGDMTPLVCPATQCLLCLGNEQPASNSRPYSFSHPDKLRRHMHDCHLRYLVSDACFPCPHPACSENLWGTTHFKDHAAVIHKVYL